MSDVRLVCDTSGSMLEGGKRLIVRGLVRQVEQYLRLGYGLRRDLQLVLWAEQVTAQVCDLREEVPEELFECAGPANGKALVELLGDSADAKVLILTDGFWSDESRHAIEVWRSGVPQDTLRVLKVGADANPQFTGDYVFESEDFFSAVDRWLDQ
jgi:hypothetical protein